MLFLPFSRAWVPIFAVTYLELPSQFHIYSNGKADLYIYECSGGDGPFNPVQTEELFSLDGNWEQIGGVGNYLFYDPTEEVPDDEIFYGALFSVIKKQELQLMPNLMFIATEIESRL